MEPEKNTIRRIEKIGAISGIVSMLFYFGAAVLPFIPDTVGRLMGFAFPLLWIIGFMGLYSFLKREHHTPTLEIAYLFGIIGAALAVTFIVVQQANFIWHDVAINAAINEESQALTKATFNGANRVQAGMDVAFDIFITISWFLFGINIARKHLFRRLMGWIICLISVGLLTINMITFPTAPAEAGWIDLGPFLGLFILVVYVWFTAISFKNYTEVD